MRLGSRCSIFSEFYVSCLPATLCIVIMQWVGGDRLAYCERTAWCREGTGPHPNKWKNRLVPGFHLVTGWCVLGDNLCPMPASLGDSSFVGWWARCLPTFVLTHAPVLRVDYYRVRARCTLAFPLTGLPKKISIRRRGFLKSSARKGYLKGV